VAAHNPYSPPASLEPAPRSSPAVRLFSPLAIAAHCAFFTPLAGAWFAVVNHRRRGDAGGARRTFLTYLLPSGVLLVLQLAGGDAVSRVTRFAVLGWSVVVARQLYVEHRAIFDAHVAAGGKAARWYLGTLPVVLVLVALLFVTMNFAE
jgi:hypothetical protein